MSAVTCEAELLHCFREIDRDEVELPSDLAFPLSLEEPIAWAMGPRAFLVFSGRPGASHARGIVFHRNSGNLPDVVAMCEWCHAVRGNGGVKLMSINSSERRRIGLYLCSDLHCVSRSREVPGPDDIPDRVDATERASRVLNRIVDFASRRLF